MNPKAPRGTSMFQSYSDYLQGEKQFKKLENDFKLHIARLNEPLKDELKKPLYIPEPVPNDSHRFCAVCS